MTNVYDLIRKLAKHSKYQNLFYLCKEFSGTWIFNNKSEFSKLQEIFMNYLFMYENLYKDLAMKKVSDCVTNCFLYEDSYLLWKRETLNKPEQETKPSDITLVATDKINFPKR